MNKKNLTSNSLIYKPYLYYDIYIKNKYLKKRNSYSQHREDSIIIKYFIKYKIIFKFYTLLLFFLNWIKKIILLRF